MLKLNLLGLPELFWEGERLDAPSPKTLAILAYLALRDSSRERSELMELFWENGKASNVRFALFKLREIKGSQDWLETSDKLAFVKADTDVLRIEQAIKEKRFRDALAIWHKNDKGPQILLKGLKLKDAPYFNDWLELERSRLDQLYLEVLQQAVEELEAARKLSEALELAYLLLEKDRLNETAHRAIMRLEHAQGNTEAALAQFERCCEILRQELGVEPLEDTLLLLREIEQPSVSQSINAVVLNALSDIPAKTEKLFGRDELLQDALGLLKGHAVLLQGFDGSGKTALAASLASEHLKQNENHKVLWLQAGDDAPEGLFDSLARAFNAHKALGQLDASGKASFIKDLLVKQDISLVVLDDVWNAYALAKLSEVIPDGTQFLITSRQRYPKLKRLTVAQLDPEASLELLSHHAEMNLSLSDAAQDLVKLLGHHAFAIRIAGISLLVDQKTPEELLEQVAQAPHGMKTPSDFVEAGRESVTALLSASLNAVSEEAFEAFMGLGVLFTGGSTPELLAFCIRREEEATERALFELQKRGLAERITELDSDFVTYRLHDLAYSFARLNNHFRLESAQRACQLFLAKHTKHFGLLDLELSNLLAAIESSGEASYIVNMVKALTIGDAYYLARGHNGRSLQLLKTAIELSKAQEDIETSHYLLARLGDTYRGLHANHDAALEAFEEALFLAREMENYQREIIMLTLIGTTKSQQGAQDASSYLEKAQSLALQEQDDKALCQVLEHRGCLAGSSGAFSESLSYFNEALQAVERLSQTYSDENELARLRFFSLVNLGETEKNLKLNQKAFEHFTEAKTLAYEQQNQLWLAYAFQGLAETHDLAQQRDLACEAFEQAFVLYQKNQATADLNLLISVMQDAHYPLPTEGGILALSA